MTEPELAAVYSQVVKCNRCGLCQPTCPIYRVTGRESSVARGHHAHIREVIEGSFDLARDLKGPIFECLMCKACTANCPPAVEIAPVIVSARSSYYRRYTRPAMHRVMFRGALPRPGALSVSARLLALAKKSGAARLARTTGMLRLLHRDLPRAEAIAGDLPLRSFGSRVRQLSLEPGDATRRVAYFNSCGFNYVFPEVAEATLRVLWRGKCAVQVLPNVCCGLPAWSYGDVEGAKALARQNLERVRSAQVDLIVTECGSCSSFLKEYAELLADDPVYAAEAKSFSGRVRDINEFLADDLKPVGLTSELGETVTYHDPCHLSRYQRITAQPRGLLTAIPGLQYVELAEADWCCGAAGTYNVAHYDLSMAVLGRKMDRLRATGATIVATSCPACMMQLGHGVRQRGLAVKVRHVTQLLDAAQSGREGTDH